LLGSRLVACLDLPEDLRDVGHIDKSPPIW
jgi:hypothetical protein